MDSKNSNDGPTRRSKSLMMCTDHFATIPALNGLTDGTDWLKHALRK